MRKFKLLITSAALLLAGVMAFGQNITVSGTVKDANGDPIPAAGVQIQGTLNGTVTSDTGEFTINAPANATLVFSSIGYANKMVPVNGQRKINVVLEEDSQLLEETIVVAFGTSTKEAFTGSAAVVSEEKLERAQVSGVTSALAGAVAGVQLTSSNGAPGSNPTIRVRGFSSISAGQSPLIIVDGAPYDGDIQNFNPSDVESMTVLKDASANALYGARGANGVIIITTKRAKSGDAVVTVDAKYGFNQKALVDYNVVTDPKAYYELHYKAMYNKNIADGLTPAEANLKANRYIFGDSGDFGLGYQVYTVPEGQLFIGSNGAVNPNATLGYTIGDYLITPDKWANEIYRNGVRQEYNVSVAGSEGRMNYYASIGYLGNEGIVANSDQSRLTGRARVDYQAKRWLKTGFNVSYTKFDYNSLNNNGSSTSTGNIWAFTSQIAPIYPLYIRNADGTKKVDSNGITMMDYGNGGNASLGRPFLSDANAYQDLLLNTNNTEGNASTGNAYADITLFPGLKLTINGTYTLDESRYTWVANPYYGQFDTTGGTVEKEHMRSYTYNLQQLLNYDKSYGLNNISLMAGHEYYNNKYYALWATHNKMFSQKNKELSGAVVDGQSSGSYITEYNVEGFLFRGQYNYDNRYFASASFRRDASSRFAPDHRWGNFWSLGGAWIVSKEPWFRTSAFDEFKLKASIGSQGNDNIGAYRYVDTFDISNSSGSVSTVFSSKGSEDITWETNTNMNAGFEFSLFKGRLSGSVEAFNRLTTDMLFSFSVAPSLGYSSYYANVGDMTNKGYEVDLSYNLVNRKNFHWNIYGNITSLKNTIKMLDEDKKTTKAYDADGNVYEGYMSGNFFIAEGLSLYTWALPEYAGVDPETGLSMWYKNVFETDESGEFVKDANGDKIWAGRETTTTYSDVNSATDGYIISHKSTVPPIYGGFGTSLDFGGFDFSINFSYQLGGFQYDGTYQNFMSSPTSSTGDNYHVDLYNSWTADNPSATIPRFQAGDTYSAASSTRWLTPAKYLNLENINLGYTFPAKISNKFLMSSLRVYVAAENVWYWSARQGFDPRQSYTSTTNATYYSPMRTFLAGITLKF